MSDDSKKNRAASFVWPSDNDRAASPELDRMCHEDFRAEGEAA